MAKNSQYQQQLEAEERQKKANAEALKVAQKNLNKRLDHLRIKDLSKAQFDASAPHDENQISFVSIYTQNPGEEPYISAIKLYKGDTEISGTGMGIHKAVKVIDSDEDPNSDVGWEFLLSKYMVDGVRHDKIYSVTPEYYQCDVYKGAPMCRFLYDEFAGRAQRGISCHEEPLPNGSLFMIDGVQKDGFHTLKMRIYREGLAEPEILEWKLIFGQQIQFEGYTQNLAYYYIQCSRTYDDNGSVATETAIYTGGSGYYRNLKMQGIFDEDYGLTVLTKAQYDAMSSHNPNVVYKVLYTDDTYHFFKNDVELPYNPLRVKAPILTLFIADILEEGNAIKLAFCSGNDIRVLPETNEEYDRLGLNYSLTDGSQLATPTIKLSEDSTLKAYYEDIALILNREDEPT